jgi:hypothetical protein
MQEYYDSKDRVPAFAARPIFVSATAITRFLLQKQRGLKIRN